MNSEMLLLRESMNNSRSKVFDNARGSGIQSKSRKISLLFTGGALASLWRKENWDANAPNWQVLWWEDEFIFNDFYFLNEVYESGSSVGGGCVGGLRKKEMIWYSHPTEMEKHNLIPEQL